MTDYDTRGFSAAGYDRNGYDPYSYDASGFDARGYDRNGYDRNGYDAAGYDRHGLDSAGYDRNGYDANGYDRRGFDAAGWDRNGYDVDGFDRHGIDRSGRNLYGVEVPFMDDNAEPARVPGPARISTDGGGESEVQVSRMIFGGVATVIVGALTAAVVCWLLMALRTNLPAETWARAGAPRIPDPATAAVLAGAAAAAAAACALALSVFVADGLRFFRLTALLLTAVWVVAVASEHSWSTWLVSALTIGAPGLAIISLAPSVRPTLRP
ncbi:hypothetical protein [Gordonia sihwensis]|uniref:Uncharacterized protein n=1 Tax=Gordonia sihwensis NBRC 108236 TaxID=1223544 RepID=L7LNN0_9ACTN|nr:hypothetical protein [Gordonia sihwensis]GAC62336.1 hypothetical protein GSI01S_33_00220 [Gordonia sihwensis NBRC 108236]